MPSGCRPGTGQTSARITHDRGGPPKPLLQEVIRQIFQSGLDTPIVFAGDEYESVGRRGEERTQRLLAQIEQSQRTIEHSRQIIARIDEVLANTDEK